MRQGLGRGNWGRGGGGGSETGVGAGDAIGGEILAAFAPSTASSPRTLRRAQIRLRSDHSDEPRVPPAHGPGRC